MLLEYIDLYCERTAPGFWNEPINALSNLSFLLAAGIAFYGYRRAGARGVMEPVLIALAACIGIGSFLFHTYANGVTELLDVVPIWSFVALYVATVIYRLSGGDIWKTGRISLIVAVCVGAGVWATSGDITTETTAGPELLNGSLQYLPAMLALGFFAGVTLLRRHPAAGLVCTAALCFAVSLGFRTVDLTSCAATGIGTHFLWHLLNGGMVLALLLVLIRHVPPVGGPARRGRIA